MRASRIRWAIVVGLMVGLIGMSGPAMAKKIKLPFETAINADGLTGAFVVKKIGKVEDNFAFIDPEFVLSLDDDGLFAGPLVLMVADRITMDSPTTGTGKFTGKFTFFDGISGTSSLFGTLKGSFEGELLPESPTTPVPAISPVIGKLKILGGTDFFEGASGKGTFSGVQLVVNGLSCGNPFEGSNFTGHSICLRLDVVEGEIRLPDGDGSEDD